jgi:predicted GIY-YIG superfamily endonuclease
MGVYRCFATDGALLYVGFSADVEQRIKQHKARSLWAKSLATYTTQSTGTIDEGFATEKAAIRDEHPLHNRVHNSVAALARRIDELGNELPEDHWRSLDQNAACGTPVTPQAQAYVDETKPLVAQLLTLHQRA